MDGREVVGRERELAILDDAVRRALAGERAIITLTGEPGIGKTCLLDQLAARITAAGGKAVWGRMWEVGLTPAFWPWIEILRALATPDEPAPALDRFDQRADATTRLARFAEVVDLVRRRAAAGPLALLFDDAHAADSSSLQLLEYAVSALAGSRVVIAIAARDGDAPPAVATALGRIQRAARRLPLGRLSREQVVALVGDRAPDPDRVWELSAGNPLFVEELVASLASEGVARLPVVSSVRAVIRDRVGRLSDDTRTTIGAAAVVGRDFRAAVLGDMLDRSVAEITAQLEAPRRLGMVTVSAGDRYRFSHALIAEAMADELEPAERARLHLRAAQALERRDGGEPSAVAHHLLAAGHLAAEAAVVAAERAAASAQAQLAFEHAAVLLERAIAALALAAPDDRRRRASLLAAWAEALQHAGQHARAGELCTEAAAIARELGDAELLARVAIVRGIEFRFGRTDPVLVSALREAEAALGAGATALRARVLARLAAAEQPALDAAGPVGRAREAIALAANLPERDRLEVSYVAMSAMMEYVPARELEPIHRETLALATRLGDRMIATHTLLRLCFTAIERFDRAELDRLRSELGALVQAPGLERWRGPSHLLDALVALVDGRFADAAAAADAAEACARPGTNDLWLVRVHRAFACAVQTRRQPRDSTTLLANMPARDALVAWFAAQDGDRETARAALDRIGRLPGDPDLGMLLVEPIVFAGTRDLAAAAYAQLAPRAGQLLVATLVGSVVVDLYDRLLLVLGRAAGLDDQVLDRHARAALEIATRLGSPVWTARVRADWADAIATRDPAKAAELRALAGAAARQLDMPGLAARCQGAQPAPPRVARTVVTCEPQGELWIVRSDGEAIHVKDSRGMQILARLIAEPGRELHVLDLVGGGEAVDGGDSGELLDPRARAQYSQRLRDLTLEREEAEAWGDAGRVERATHEIEALTEELERAIGLGGRARKLGSASERARSNVQRRVAHALQAIRAASPRIGEHLLASVRTGTYCSYDPRG